MNNSEGDSDVNLRKLWNCLGEIPDLRNIEIYLRR